MLLGGTLFTGSYENFLHLQPAGTTPRIRQSITELSYIRAAFSHTAHIHSLLSGFIHILLFALLILLYKNRGDKSSGFYILYAFISNFTEKAVIRAADAIYSGGENCRKV